VPVARFPPVLVLAVVLAATGGATAPAWAAAKTDVVVLRNGNTMTGEITELDRGRLTFKTDDMGTLAIEWDKVTSVTASATFELHELGGGQYFGALRPGPQAGELTVATLSGTDKVLPLWRVVKIERLGATIWQRLDGSVDAGMSYTSSSELLTIDLAARVALNRPGHGISLDGSSTITRQPDAAETSRNALTFSYRRRRPGHWAEFAQAQAEQNKELGFDLRGSLTGGAGRYLMQGRRHDLLTALGLRVNREKPLEGESTSNLEAALGFTFDRFSYDFPKVDIYATVSGFAGLTDWGRVRAELDVRIKREILRDFSISLRVYESYDSRPVTEGAAKNDYGGSVGIGWTF
jgi:putative salt-induced outer membrane protein YdiY